MEGQILEALEAYFQAVESQKEADPSRRQALRPHFERLDTFSARLPESSDPQLRHFMARKSYDKARALLRGPVG